MSDTSSFVVVVSDGSLARLLQAAHKIWYFERATAHVLCGWIPKLRSYTHKTGCTRILFNCASTAQGLERTLGAFENATTLRQTIPSAWVQAMEAIDRSSDAPTMFGALFGQLQAYLAEEYRVALSHADELLHPALYNTLRAGLQALENRSTLLPGWTHVDTLAVKNSTFEQAWQTGSTPEGSGINPLWAPVDRVPHAARPLDAKLPQPGSMRPLPMDGLMDPSGIGLVLHNNINGEYTTMELMVRCSYEHPEMPSAFHMDMARHAADEARHALALERMAARYGVKFGDYPVFTSTYDSIYQFDPCEKGSQDELLWRLLLRATVQEGESLDDLAFQARKRTFLGQDQLAEVFSAILADEIFHVRSGLKWSRFLCTKLNRSEIQEREAANEYYRNGLLIRRAQFVMSNPDEVAEERSFAAQRNAYRKAAGLDLPFGRDFNQEAREFATFSPADIEQARRWEAAQ